MTLQGRRNCIVSTQKPGSSRTPFAQPRLPSSLPSINTFLVAPLFHLSRPLATKMRFSLAIAALSAVAQAQDFEQYKAQFQNFIGKMGASIPRPDTQDPVGAFEAKTGEMRLSTLTLDNWKETLYEPVPASASEPVEWWLFITGGNKTCMGERLALGHLIKC